MAWVETIGVGESAGSGRTCNARYPVGFIPRCFHVYLIPRDNIGHYIALFLPFGRIPAPTRAREPPVWEWRCAI